jgi:CDP-glycerol glycerophosphotransferase
MKIVYNSFHGRDADHPRAIYEQLAERPSIHHVWFAEEHHQDGFPDEVPTVDIGTAPH